MSRHGFLFELKRRRVYRVAAAYAVVGWLLIQVVTQVFPVFGLPGWLDQAAVLLLLIGFPVALVLAWAFDATPPHAAVVVAGSSGDAAVAPRRSYRGPIAVGLIGVALATIAGAAWRISHSDSAASVAPRHPAALYPASHAATGTSATGGAPDPTLPQTMAGLIPIGPKSIAVLPFENLSAEAENRYFAEGVQDMILTKLADIGDLKVISRTSTMKYASQPDNLRIVARQLAVANILEGSVQKAGNQVLINVQLIDARTDTHLWAQAYTRTLNNIFGVEGEVAETIAQALHATLTAREQQTLGTKPTQNADAYNAYLHGLASSVGAGGTAQSYQRTAGFYAEAVRHDPAFALAWARLSEIDSRIYQLRYGPISTVAAEAKQAADTALKLAPDSGEALLARGLYFSRVAADFPRATADLTEARKRLPNSGEVLAAFAEVAARQGHWDAAIADIDQTSVVDPRNARLLLLHVRIHMMRREFNDASAVLAHALAVAPDDASLIACKASIAQALGQLDPAQALLAPLPLQPDDPAVFKAQIMQRLYRHQYAAASQALQSALAQADPSLAGDIGDYRYLAGFTRQLAGDTSGAHAAWLAARNQLTNLQQRFPDEPDIAADLGLVDAGLGDTASALALGARAMHLQPASSDATLGPAWQEQLARIEAQTGQKDRALADLRQLLQTPYRSAFYGSAITPSLLRADPTWNPLRGDPRFQALLKQFPDVKPASAAMAGGR